MFSLAQPVDLTSYLWLRSAKVYHLKNVKTQYYKCFILKKLCHRVKYCHGAAINHRQRLDLEFHIVK